MTRKFKGLLIVALGICFAQAPLLPAATLVFERFAKLDYDLANKSVPHWGGGALVAVEDDNSAHPTFISFDAEGKQVAAVVFTIPDALIIGVYDWARASDGVLAVCGLSYDSAGRGANFIALISPSGEDLKIFRVSPFAPHVLTWAPDGTIWAAGMEVVKGAERPQDAQRDVVRHFSRSGALLNSFVPRSTIGSFTMITDGWMAASGNRVGWYTGPSFGPESQYVEVADGSVRRFPGVPLTRFGRVTGLALTEIDAFVSTWEKELGRWSLLKLDRTKNVWAPVELPGELRANRWAALHGYENGRFILNVTDRFTYGFWKLAE